MSAKWRCPLVWSFVGRGSARQTTQHLSPAESRSSVTTSICCPLKSDVWAPGWQSPSPNGPDHICWQSFKHMQHGEGERTVGRGRKAARNCGYNENVLCWRLRWTGFWSMCLFNLLYDFHDSFPNTILCFLTIYSPTIPWLFFFDLQYYDIFFIFDPWVSQYYLTFLPWLKHLAPSLKKLVQKQ